MLQHWVSEGEFYIGGFVLHITSLSWLRLHVDVIVLNPNELVRFARWLPQDQIDTLKYIYMYKQTQLRHRPHYIESRFTCNYYYYILLLLL